MLTLIRLLTLRAGDPVRRHLRNVPNWRGSPRARGSSRPADDTRGRMILGYAYRALRDPALAAPQFEAAAATARRTSGSPVPAGGLPGGSASVRRGPAAPSKRCARNSPTIPRSPTRSATSWRSGAWNCRAPRRWCATRWPASRKIPSTSIRSAGSPFAAATFRPPSICWCRPSNAAPGQPEILEHLGLTLQALGRVEEAARVLRQALDGGGRPGTGSTPACARWPVREAQP